MGLCLTVNLRLCQTIQIPMKKIPTRPKAKELQSNGIGQFLMSNCCKGIAVSADTQSTKQNTLLWLLPLGKGSLEEQKRGNATESVQDIMWGTIDIVDTSLLRGEDDTEPQ